MFALTAKFAEAVALVNGLPPAKLPLLLNRIIASIQVQVVARVVLPSRTVLATTQNRNKPPSPLSAEGRAVQDCIST